MEKKVIKKKSTNSKLSTSKKKQTKTPRPEDWRNKYFFWRQKEIPQIAFITLAEQMVDYMVEHWDDKNLITLESILNHLRVSTESFYNDYLPKSSHLRDAHKFCKQAIADTRYKRSFNNDGNFPTMRMTQYQYDRKWKEAEEYHALLKALDKDTSKDDLIKEIFKEVMKEQKEDGSTQSKTKTAPVKDS